MARSQLLKDAVNGQISIETILLRLKVILADLENEKIMNWVNGELEGYKDIDVLPPYRIFHGNLIGSYVINYTTQYNEAPVPLEVLLPFDKVEEIRTINLRIGIGAIQNALKGENRENLSSIIPTAYCHAISKGELQILGMRVKISSTQLEGIVSHVKSKLVEVIMELESKFTNLDELDIKSQIEDHASIKQTVYNNIENIIYKDESIKVGDNNKLSKSEIGHTGRE